MHVAPGHPGLEVRGHTRVKRGAERGVGSAGAGGVWAHLDPPGPTWKRLGAAAWSDRSLVHAGLWKGPSLFYGQFGNLRISSLFLYMMFVLLASPHQDLLHVLERFAAAEMRISSKVMVLN